MSLFPAYSEILSEGRNEENKELGNILPITSEGQERSWLNNSSYTPAEPKNNTGSSHDEENKGKEIEKKCERSDSRYKKKKKRDRKDKLYSYLRASDSAEAVSEEITKLLLTVLSCLHTPDSTEVVSEEITKLLLTVLSCLHTSDSTEAVSEEITKLLLTVLSCLHSPDSTEAVSEEITKLLLTVLSCIHTPDSTEAVSEEEITTKLKK
ncbi:hypothetical protein J6590_065892 [Homalodisca vitripennis]|nr:hypothetical protein J6590_065892 [Homalodisca vitripennis]